MILEHQISDTRPDTGFTRTNSPFLGHIPYPEIFPNLEIIPNPKPKSPNTNLSGEFDLANAYRTDNTTAYFLNKKGERNGNALREPLAPLDLATAYRQGITGEYFNRQKAQRLDEQRYLRVEPHVALASKPADIIETPMADAGVATEQELEPTTEASVVPIPTIDDLAAQEAYATRGSAGFTPQPESKGWFREITSRVKTKAVLAFAGLAIAAGAIATGISAKIWGGSNQNADNPQPQNAATKTVPSSETSQGVFDKTVVPVSPTTVAEKAPNVTTAQPKPVETVIPFGGSFEFLSPRGQELATRQEQTQKEIREGKQPSNPLTQDEVREINQEFLSILEKQGPIKTNPTSETPTKEDTKPEQITEQPCDILPAEYCSKAELIEWSNNGQIYKIIGFKDLPAGTPIYAPVQGQYTKATSPEPFTGYFASVSESSLQTGKPTSGYTFIGDLKFDNMFSKTVKPGDLLGHLSDSRVNNFGYNLMLRITQRDSATGKFFTPDTVVDQFFPGLTEKPFSKTINYSGQTKPVIVDHFQETKK